MCSLKLAHRPISPPHSEQSAAENRIARTKLLGIFGYKTLTEM